MYNSRKLSFACISLLMVLKVLDQLVTSFPRAITDYQSLCIISEKDSVTGLEVYTLQSSSRIFQVTGLTFHHINVSLLFVFMYAHIRRKLKLSFADSLEAFL